MRGIPLGVALVAAALYLLRLGGAPFIDPPEGFHAEIAREMTRLGDWITPHVNGVRYFDKPPVLYWLMAGSFSVAGVGEVTARVWSALAAVGIAVSAWSTSGSGTGYAKAGTASSLTLADASASTAADLYPGGSGAVKIKVTNPNSFPVKVTSVTRSATGSITSDKGAACDASTGVTFTDQTGLTLTLAAGATGTFSLAGAASMSNSSDNSCQGAIFSIPVDVTAVSNA